MVLFPEPPPKTQTLIPYWDGLEALLAPGGIALLALPSSEAEIFDRKKRRGFTRLGDLRREGFRALAYRLGE
jgi:hypothetical protein